MNLETSAVAIASLKVTYADMQASLKNGVFTLAKLTGQFYGGAVDFNGTIDATKDALMLDLRGSLQGNDKLDEILMETVKNEDKMNKLKAEVEGGNNG